MIESLNEFFILMASLMLFVLFGCESSEMAPLDKLALKETYKVATESYTFHANPEKYGDMESKRAKDELCAIETEISKVQRTDNILTITVARPMDCDIDYEIIWNGEILESYPMQSNLYIHAIGNNCSGTHSTDDVLSIDLEQVLKDIDASIIADIDFTIKDACRLLDVTCNDNCNVTIRN